MHFLGIILEAIEVVEEEASSLLDVIEFLESLLQNDVFEVVFLMLLQLLIVVEDMS